MAVAHRIESLKSKHAALEVALHKEETHARPNEARVIDMKRDKLRIKDELEKLCHSSTGECDRARTG